MLCGFGGKLQYTMASKITNLTVIAQKKENNASESKPDFHFMFICLFLINKCKQSLTKKDICNC